MSNNNDSLYNIDKGRNIYNLENIRPYNFLQDKDVQIIILHINFFVYFRNGVIYGPKGLAESSGGAASCDAPTATAAWQPFSRSSFHR